jgi:hypothetical protein
MGMDRTVCFPSGTVPAWDAIRTQLIRLGLACPLRMIDGLPAFPDETPEPGWRELRVGVAGGMVTIRSASDSLTCVVWGNSTDELRAGWDAVCWACAAAGEGVIDTPSGSLPAAAFAAAAGLRPA